MALLATEASVFFITLISIDRFLSVVFPFGTVKLRSKSSKISVAIIWVVSLIVALVPVLLAGPQSDFYDLSDVCIGLPLITRPASFKIEPSGISNRIALDITVGFADSSRPAWYFSITLFLGVNLICFLTILVCYVFILMSARKSSAMAGRKEIKEEMKMAIKMAAIVGTDFLCWFPVIMMGILSQTGTVIIPLDAYVWCVVFVLPINSSLNPYLYTLANLSNRKNQMGGSRDRSSSNIQMKKTFTTTGDIKS